MLSPTADSVETVTSPLETAPRKRLVSIDILRAITMVLMIFVNDLWSLKGVPVWLEHVPYEADGMGLADTVFPAFLFIVGMSIPLAIQSRRKKGYGNVDIVKHILIRSASLLLMGVFLVNGENINAEATGLSRGLWNVLCCFSFILIWNSYPRSTDRRLVQISRGVGFVLLITLAFLFRGGEGENLNGFSTYWWGILGLIGWSYLAGALIVAFSGDRLSLPVAAWLTFSALSILTAAEIIPAGRGWSVIPTPISRGTLAGLTMGGAITTLLFQRYRRHATPQRAMIVLVVVAVLLLILGGYTRTFWGISKLRETPAWLFLCSAITLLAFVGIYWLVDRQRKADWFNFIRPAGYNTLLCYLIPYFAYAFINLTGIGLPDALLSGSIGLLTSFLFALLCVAITGGLSQLGIRLKL